MGTSIAHFIADILFNDLTIDKYGSLNSPVNPLPKIASIIISQSFNQEISFTDL